jgi:oligopeptide transport system substrate-binding protein
MCGWKIKLLAIVALVLACGCARKEPVAPAFAQILRVSQRNEPADLDPATATLPDEFFIIRALSEGLLIPDPAGGAPLPAAAASFTASADGLAYTFRLRTDANWSNGEPVTAADFVESYRRLLTPATAAQKAHVFYPVKNARAFVTGTLTDFSAVGFAAPDARTLIVTLEKPTPRFPYYVASGPWIPVNPRVVAQHGRKWTQPAHFAGNGPFTLTEWRQHKRIVVKKSPAYRAAAGVRLDEIQFLAMDSSDTEDLAYRAGQLDVTMDVPKSKLAVYAKERPAELQRLPLAETRYLAFNTTRPPLNDERVRRALSLAIDRPRIVERVLLGGQPPAANFLSPSLAPSGLSHSSHSLHSPTEAAFLLTAAGFPSGKNFPRFEVTAWSRSQVATLEAIQAMWRQHLGIECTIAIREAKVHLAALAAGTYDIAFVTTLIDVADPAAVLSNLATGSPGNYPRWSDPAFDRAVTTGDLAAAEARIAAAQPVAPLYYGVHTWLTSPRVRGWQEDAYWARNYLHVSLAPK